MTIKEYINGFIDLLDKEHRPPVGFRWSARLVLFHTESVRSKLLDGKYNLKNKPLDHQDMHLIPCIPMKDASLIDCKTFKDLGCEVVKKSVDPIPELISRKHFLVRSIDGSFVYDYIRWEDYTHLLNSKYQAERDGAYYSLKNETEGVFLYILNDNVKSVSTEGIHHSIIDPYLFPTCDKIDYTCKDYREFKFPMSPAMKNDMYMMTYQSMLNVDKVAEPNLIGNESTDIINKTL